MIKTWIPAKYPEGANSVNCTTSHTPLPGTNCLSDFVRPVLFHQFGQVSEVEQYRNPSTDYIEERVVHSIAAVVEHVDGTVDQVPLSYLKFVIHPALTEEEKTELRQKFKEFGVHLLA